MIFRPSYRSKCRRFHNRALTWGHSKSIRERRSRRKEVLALGAEIQLDERIAKAARLFAVDSTHLKDSRIAMFFLIAYAISWAAWITLFARHFSPLAGPGRWLYLTAVLAPHGSALVSTAVEGGRAELGAFTAGLRAKYHFDGQSSRSAFRPSSTWCVTRSLWAFIWPTIRFFITHREPSQRSCSAS